MVAERGEVVCRGTYLALHARTARPVEAAFAHNWTVRDGRIARLVQSTSK